MYVYVFVALYKRQTHTHSSTIVGTSALSDPSITRDRQKRL
jgi:hypothetical protein